MRIDLIPLDRMDAAQRRIHDEAVAGKRGRLPAPLAAWLHSPPMAEHAQRLGAFLRYDTSLSPALSELAILVTARAWTSHYEWYAHKKEALKAGVDAAAIDAIAERRRPALTDPAAEAVYDYATALHERHVVTDEIHGRARRHLGERGIVELIGLLGYYTLISMTLNALEIGLPEGETVELKP
ncbi:MAG: carboxymuconolactone decarboxylase family protein [Alphaproteobacteria bacterium]|nr:carboxymuconolactone decarboxylase family protein [Alphaproteobacteria bacterium]